MRVLIRISRSALPAIEFKITPLKFNVFKEQTLSYLKALIVSYYLSRALGSQTAGLLVAPGVSESKIGGRAFSRLQVCVWDADKHPVYLLR